MSQPRPESRLSELESQMALHSARIRELSDDTAESLRDLKQDIKQLSDSITASYKQIGDTFMAFGNTMATKEDIAKVEATMATKADIAKMEARFDQLEATQVEQGQKLDQIIVLMQQKPDK